VKVVIDGVFTDCRLHIDPLKGCHGRMAEYMLSLFNYDLHAGERTARPPCISHF
jgi:hypothetical protein